MITSPRALQIDQLFLEGRDIRSPIYGLSLAECGRKFPVAVRAVPEAGARGPACVHEGAVASVKRTRLGASVIPKSERRLRTIRPVPLVGSGVTTVPD